ncbi:MAG: ABC transporter ATP-binding protein [Clostridia bacterium]|nr:ABC transporter ATP-binding protein [Clostridia bacterium]
MSEIMLRVENVSKQYRLGAIGGTTLKEDLQRLSARLRKKEDPTSKIGQKKRPISNEKFLALDGVSFEVKKGEALGIIGKNGAGKSTLLKLITRITGPSKGTISLNGRVASMLEVGTGFHPELTGRENIYMNGAILGMSKKEIDAKIEQIIDFSEVRQFIDTPVKRYSSGMYVKLAFSVAAHLDSEIVIMDEVLAVGDMAFQNKCLTKMRQSAQEEGKTVLYVSHNMNTIRQLCDRVIVLDKGKLIFDGDVEEGIAIYMNNADDKRETFVDLSDKPRPENAMGGARMDSIELICNEKCTVTEGEKLPFRLKFHAERNLNDVRFRMIVRYSDDTPVGLARSENIGSFEAGENGQADILFDTSHLAKGVYYFSIALFQTDEVGNTLALDHVTRAIKAEIVSRPGNDIVWSHRWWGAVDFPIMEVTNERRNDL